MIPEERRLRMADRLSADDLVRADQLAAEFDVSAETIRRDLLVLEERGLIRRVYGGAVATARDARPRAVEAPYEERTVAYLDCKEAMAELAVGLVDADDTLIFDVGTSVTEVARALRPDAHGVALTSSLPTASELADRPGLSVLVSGGRVRPGDLATAGPHATDFFGGYYADVAFLGSGGIHPEAGLTDYYPDEIAVRKVMLARANRTYVLAHCAKLGRVAVGRVCALTDVTAVITDDHADPAVIDELTESGVRVLVAPVPSEGASPVAGAVAPMAAPATTGPEREAP